jgi:uncharacterized protein (DUF488 family)
MLKMPREDYLAHYRAILEKLEPRTVFTDLHLLANGKEPVLLCWEKANVFCHRRLVAEWLEKALGIEVVEIGLDRKKMKNFWIKAPTEEVQLDLF